MYRTCLLYSKVAVLQRLPEPDQKRTPIGLLVPKKEPQAFYFTTSVLINPNKPHYISQGNLSMTCPARSALSTFEATSSILTHLVVQTPHVCSSHTGWEKVLDVFIIFLKGQWTLAALFPTQIILKPKRAFMGRCIVQIFTSTKDHIQWLGWGHCVSLLKKMFWTLNTTIKPFPSSVMTLHPGQTFPPAMGMLVNKPAPPGPSSAPPGIRDNSGIITGSGKLSVCPIRKHELLCLALKIRETWSFPSEHPQLSPHCTGFSRSKTQTTL